MGINDIVASRRIAGGSGGEFERVRIYIHYELDLVVALGFVVDEGRFEYSVGIYYIAARLDVAVSVEFVGHELIDRLRANRVALGPVDAGPFKERRERFGTEYGRTSFLQIEGLTVGRVLSVAVFEYAFAYVFYGHVGYVGIAHHVALDDLSHRFHIHRVAVYNAYLAYFHAAAHADAGYVGGTAAGGKRNVEIHFAEILIGDVEQVGGVLYDVNVFGQRVRKAVYRRSVDPVGPFGCFIGGRRSQAVEVKTDFGHDGRFRRETEEQNDQNNSDDEYDCYRHGDRYDLLFFGHISSFFLVELRPPSRSL